jgi:predicted DNA-binding transcriptional regulator AlpA
MKKEIQRHLLRMRSLTVYLDLSRGYIYQKINEGEFPPGDIISVGVRAWKKSEIDQWVEKRIRMGRSVS